MLDVCHEVDVEPKFLKLEDENLYYQSTRTIHKAGHAIEGNNLESMWGSKINTKFFNLKVFGALAKS